MEFNTSLYQDTVTVPDNSNCLTRNKIKYILCRTTINKKPTNIIPDL